MFAALLTGKLVQTDFVEISTGKFLLNLLPLENSNHIVVFLTGQTPLPECFGAAVHFGIVDNENTSWSYLGFLSNEHPSAIYKVSGLKPKLENILQSPFGTISIPTPCAGITAQLGISIEPLTELQGQISVVESTNNPLKANNDAQFVTYAAQNLFDYASSFAQNISGTSESFVSLSVIQRWYEMIQRKLTFNSNFWKK